MKNESAIVLPIICALMVAVAPHTPGLPLWINIWCLLMWGYMLTRLKTGWPVPNAKIRYALTFAGILGLMFTYNVQLGSDAFVGLLALMAAIKPFEMPSHRHRMITILLTYFIIITSLFRAESMFIVLYMFFSVFVTTLALVRINDPGVRFSKSLNLAAAIMAQAIPLMVMFFLLFPRLPGSLVGFKDKTRGISGFSNRLNPGSVSSLVQDQSLAFRAEFKDILPGPDQLYWRGIIFQEFDGKSWIPKELDRPGMSFPDVQSETQDYAILLEPHNRSWLMALDLPVKGPSWARLTLDHTLKSQRPVNKKVKYRVTSLIPNLSKNPYPALADDKEGIPFAESKDKINIQDLRVSKKMARAIISKSDNKNPKSRSLAFKIAGNASTPMEKARLLLAYFTKNQFVYTFNPPLAMGHPIDYFLLESKKGYCEHYASAFAFMMNVLGVPARVVGGYLGGELNPYGNYLIIRQSYAHAWAEIFDPKKGWIRMDPTAAVAPERIQTNPDGSSAVPQAFSGAMAFSRKLKFALDAVNLRWEAWFTGYSYFEQQAWIQKLGLGKGTGFKSVAGVLTVIILIGLVIFSGLVFWLFRSRRTKPDPIQNTYELFCGRLDRLGLTKIPSQGPVDYAKMCAEKAPGLALEITAITDLYVRLRFQKDCPNKVFSDFKSLVMAFKPTMAGPAPGIGPETKKARS